jgi:hypothetical protein
VEEISSSNLFGKFSTGDAVFKITSSISNIASAKNKLWGATYQL